MNSIKATFNLANFEIIAEQTDGKLLGGFSASIGGKDILGIELYEGGSNNCEGGNCVSGCGTGQNVNCNTVSGCGKS